VGGYLLVDGSTLGDDEAFFPAPFLPDDPPPLPLPVEGIDTEGAGVLPTLSSFDLFRV
jgi:hypothetical protein